MAFNYFDNSSILGGHVRSGTSGINNVESNRIHGSKLGGGALFTTVGSHTWEAPPGVTSVCVVCIGGGGGGMYFNASGTTYTYAMSGGGGGTLAYLNDYPVVPGQSYTVQVGAGGSAGAYTTGSTAGGESYAFGSSICRALGGNPGRYNVDVATAGWSISSAYGTFGRGPGGGTIRAPSPGTSGYGPCGGGGAGGYGTDDGVGIGGTGRDDLVASGDNGTGGSGAGGGACNTTTNIDLHDHVSGGGGGTGVYGLGASGIASTDGWGGGGSGGEGGGTAHHGAPGGPPVANAPSSQDGGKYGGGGGGQSHNVSMGADAGDGAQGAVRIIWGSGRAFPSTKVSLADSLAGETEY